MRVQPCTARPAAAVARKAMHGYSVCSAGAKTIVYNYYGLIWCERKILFWLKIYDRLRPSDQRSSLCPSQSDVWWLRLRHWLSEGRVDFSPTFPSLFFKTCLFFGEFLCIVSYSVSLSAAPWAYRVEYHAKYPRTCSTRWFGTTLPAKCCLLFMTVCLGLV